MKRITYLTISFILLICIYSCAGYEPIYKPSKLQFVIAEYTIKANKKLGKAIYSKINNLTKLNKNNQSAQSIKIMIEVSKNKTATVKNSAGKILEYKVNLSTHIEINNFLTNELILNENFSYSSSYKTQDQYSETLKLENNIIENLLNKTYEDLIIKILEIK